ncbi:hypothetical protein [Mycobacterium sp.]|nr:hypothetical protein [Mycobacterium sp.]
MTITGLALALIIVGVVLLVIGHPVGWPLAIIGLILLAIGLLGRASFRP